MKKIIVSASSLPVAVATGYGVALYADSWSNSYARQHPGLGFGSLINAQFQIITPAIIILTLACGGVNYYIYSTTKAKHGDKSAATTRLVAAAMVVISVLVLIPFIYGFGRMLFQ